MIRRYFKIIVLALIVICIILGVWWITDPSRKKPIEQLPQKEIISQLEIDGINLQEYEMYDMVPIDKENYILITRQFAVNEELTPIPNAYVDNYYIYKYNIETGLGQANININSFFQIAGIDTNKKIMYLATTSLEIPKDSVESPYNIVELNYETMQIQKTLADKTNYYNCIISDNSNLWTYLVNNSLYSSGYNFENEKLLVDNSEKSLTTTYMYPCDIANNSIVYMQYDSGVDGKTGIGIVNNDGTNTRLIEAQIPVYIEYNSATNEIYYTTNDTMNQVLGFNIDTLAKRVLFEYSPEDKGANIEYYISPDTKRIVIVENKYVDRIPKITMHMYEVGSNKWLAQYQPEDNSKVSDISFIKDKVVFRQSGKLYEWNYTISQK